MNALPPLSTNSPLYGPILDRIQNPPGQPALLLLTGHSGSGKTTWCSRLYQTTRQGTILVTGLISPPVFNDREKVAIDLLDLESAEQRRLADRNDPKVTPVERQPATTGWGFSAETLAWGNRCLEKIQKADLLILDEMGPLEFDRGQGLMAGFRLLDERRAQLAILALRPDLLARARARWPWAETLELPPRDLKLI